MDTQVLATKVYCDNEYYNGPTVMLLKVDNDFRTYLEACLAAVAGVKANMGDAFQNAKFKCAGVWAKSGSRFAYNGISSILLGDKETAWIKEFENMAELNRVDGAFMVISADENVFFKAFMDDVVDYLYTDEFVGSDLLKSEHPIHEVDPAALQAAIADMLVEEADEENEENWLDDDEDDDIGCDDQEDPTALDVIFEDEDDQTA